MKFSHKFVVYLFNVNDGFMKTPEVDFENYSFNAMKSSKFGSECDKSG